MVYERILQRLLFIQPNLNSACVSRVQLIEFLIIIYNNRFYPLRQIVNKIVHWKFYHYEIYWGISMHYFLIYFILHEWFNISFMLKSFWNVRITTENFGCNSRVYLTKEIPAFNYHQLKSSDSWVHSIFMQAAAHLEAQRTKSSNVQALNIQCWKCWKGETVQLRRFICVFLSSYSPERVFIYSCGSWSFVHICVVHRKSKKYNRKKMHTTLSIRTTISCNIVQSLYFCWRCMQVVHNNTTDNRLV